MTEVGSKVEKFKIGDKVGIGCLVGSCRQCEECINNGKSYCPKLVFSVNDRYYDGTMTYGGFSNLMVCKEHFIICWPENLPLDSGAPLLCAGITTYSPLRRFGLDKPGVNVGVVGLHGIGYLSVKFAKALGSRVTVISTSANKKKEAIETFGADEFLIGQDQEQTQVPWMVSFILSLQNHSLLPPLNQLKPHSKLILVGIPQKLEVPILPLILEGKVIVGIASGGVKEVEEMVEFAAQHNILPDVEVTPIDYVNKAMGRLEKSDVKYRFVVNVGNSIKVE